MNKRYFLTLLILFLFTLNSCAADTRFSRHKQRTKEKSKFFVGQVLTGECSYYAKKFHGRKTANGEIFDMYKMTAAHKTLPFDTIIEVENLENNKKVKVRINDRGPFKPGRIVDLSFGAALELDIIKNGTAKIKARIIKLDD
jgi:rare lipoprotein A